MYKLEFLKKHVFEIEIRSCFWSDINFSFFFFFFSKVTQSIIDYIIHKMNVTSLNFHHFFFLPFVDTS